MHTNSFFQSFELQEKLVGRDIAEADSLFEFLAAKATQAQNCIQRGVHFT